MVQRSACRASCLLSQRRSCGLVGYTASPPCARRSHQKETETRLIFCLLDTLYRPILKSDCTRMYIRAKVTTINGDFSEKAWVCGAWSRQYLSPRWNFHPLWDKHIAYYPAYIICRPWRVNGWSAGGCLLTRIRQNGWSRSQSLLSTPICSSPQRKLPRPSYTIDQMS